VRLVAGASRFLIGLVTCFATHVRHEARAKALSVSLISRCDSAAIVSNTRQLLPEPETPVNTVSRRFGISMLTSFTLFSRADVALLDS
jgi:hypothetical protein